MPAEALRGRLGSLPVGPLHHCNACGFAATRRKHLARIPRENRAASLCRIRLGLGLRQCYSAVCPAALLSCWTRMHSTEELPDQTRRHAPTASARRDERLGQPKLPRVPRLQSPASPSCVTPQEPRAARERQAAKGVDTPTPCSSRRGSWSWGSAGSRATSTATRRVHTIWRVTVAGPGGREYNDFVVTTVGLVVSFVYPPSIQT
eukprot:scaffold112500_cov63-Phaeocystis_antarctica.AAC.2